MTMKKTIAVVGATGAQGGGLVRAILNDPKKQFHVRALTRDTRSDKARELARLGAEVVKADLDDLRSLNTAFEGAYGAFCVTNYWEHHSPEKEIEQAGNMAEAAKQQGVKHVIWSTLEDTRKWMPLNDKRMPVLKKRYFVPHTDAKGEANKEFSQRRVPTTYLITSFYWENFIHFGMQPKRGADGVLALTLPMGNKRLPGIAVGDIGKCAFAIFERGKQFIGETVGIAGEHLTGEQMAASLSKALGETVVYNDIEPAAYRALDFPGADDLGNMFQFKRDFNDYFCRVRNLNEARKLNPDMMSFDTWLEKNWDRIPIEKKAA